MTSQGPIHAAGCVVWRHGSRELEVVLVHRPRWTDWSFPKGKLDLGESAIACAVREVAEETGLAAQLGPRLADQHYIVDGGAPKVVNYWSAEPPKKADLSAYQPNAEIDDVRWVPLSTARERLTYPRDADLLDVFAKSAYDTRPLVIVRHAHARSRRAWRTDDSDRPLKAEGIRQAARLVPLLAAYGVSQVMSSDAVRCVDTVLPYANSRRGVTVALNRSLSEDGANVAGIGRTLTAAMKSSRRMAICSHRPVLPFIFEAIGVEPIALEPGALVVVHRHRGKVRETEVHSI